MSQNKKLSSKSRIGKHKAENFWGSIGRLLQYISKRKWGFLLIAIVSIVAILFQVITPQILGQATTIIFEGVSQGANTDGTFAIDFEALTRILVTVTIMYLLSALFQYLQGYFLSRLSAKVIREIRQDMRDKLNRLPLSVIDRASNGEILSRAVNDVENLATSLQQTIAQTLTSVVQFFGTLVMMFVISPLLATTGIVSVVVGTLFISIIAPRSQKQFAKQQKLQGELNTYTEENYTGQIVNKAFNQEQNKIAQFEAKSLEYYEASWRAQLFSGLLMPLMNVAKDFGYILVAVFGGLKVANGQMPLGEVQAMLQYTNQLSQPMKQTAQMVNQIQRMVASAERIFEFLDLDEMTDDLPYMESKDDEAFMVFDSVQFGYEAGEDNLLMTDFNLNVNKGEMVAIVGPTGAGKSTLINLIERFYEVSNGSIRIEGQDIRQFSREAVRNRLGMVLQDTWLFKGTIMENIKYGAHHDVSDEEVYEAAKMAHADDFIRTLPDGYETVINEDASNISQGQRQLLTITRAFISDPEILILDEATSSIDTRTEILIQQAMKRLLNGRTSFVVAHRLSTIQDADQIIVLDHGDVIETGNHESLLEQKGFYYNLYQSQFSVD